jgi:trk system potassium uptake protein TrkA
MKKSIAVIGLGRFGGSITRTLIESGQEVLAIDMSEERVNEYMNIATHCVVGNAQDEQVLKSLGIRNFDCVVVAIGEDVQASILTTLIVKEMGVKKVWAKAKDDYHARVLEKIGADRVVHPERDMGVRLAHQLVAKNLIDYLEISEKFSMAEIQVTNPKLIDKTLQELDLPKNFKISVTAIRRYNGDVELAAGKQVIRKGDSVLVVGRTADVEYFDEFV